MCVIEDNTYLEHTLVTNYVVLGRCYKLSLIDTIEHDYGECGLEIIYCSVRLLLLFAKSYCCQPQ